MTLPPSPLCFSLLVGIPFLAGGRTREGCDCWGLHRLALAEVWGIQLPAYSDLYADCAELAESERLIRERLDSWAEVPPGEEGPSCAILLRVGRHASHIGTVVSRGKMLHTYSGSRSRVDCYRDRPFKERVVGFFRLRQP